MRETASRAPIALGRVRLICSVAIAIAVAACAKTRIEYSRAELAADGELVVSTMTGERVIPPPDSDQVGYDQIVVAPDHRSVGWLALYKNCCTTYPIPLKLFVLTDGTRQVFRGETDLPIWRWQFSADGNSVALRQAPLHGMPQFTHFELRDIRSGMQQEYFDADSTNSGQIPDWARPLNDHPASDPSALHTRS